MLKLETSWQNTFVEGWVLAPSSPVLARPYEAQKMSGSKDYIRVFESK
jgi:hypothetical protein